jgi:hypothetical protein
VNLVGYLLCARQAIGHLRGGGAIVNISSAAATLGSPHEYVHYAATKAATDAMTVGPAKELASRGRAGGGRGRGGLAALAGGLVHHRRGAQGCRRGVASAVFTSAPSRMPGSSSSNGTVKSPSGAPGVPIRR